MQERMEQHKLLLCSPGCPGYSVKGFLSFKKPCAARHLLALLSHGSLPAPAPMPGTFLTLCLPLFPPPCPDAGQHNFCDEFPSHGRRRRIVLHSPRPCGSLFHKLGSPETPVPQGHSGLTVEGCICAQKDAVRS